jgi:hypothetical protein
VIIFTRTDFIRTDLMSQTVKRHRYYASEEGSVNSSASVCNSFCCQLDWLGTEIRNTFAVPVLPNLSIESLVGSLTASFAARFCFCLLLLLLLLLQVTHHSVDYK